LFRAALQQIDPALRTSCSAIQRGFFIQLSQGLLARSVAFAIDAPHQGGAVLDLPSSF
jgi:hypothetical protein